jgi:tight adherence protein C
MNGNLLLLSGFFTFVLAVSSLAVYLLFGRRQVEAERSEFRDDLIIGSEPDRTLQGVLVSLFHWFGAMMPSSEATRAAMLQRLNHAGYRGQEAMTAYFGVKCTSAILLGVIVCLFSVWNQSGGFSIGGPFAAAVCGMGFGFLLPERFLDALVAARNDRIRRALPSALDLIVMSLEAGQSLDQALVLASKGLGKFSHDLSAELMQVHLETRASKSRAEAVRHLAERNGEPELRKLCNLLTDSDRFGSSLAPTLRQHSKFLRVRFRQRAQEQARKLTVKMVFPVFFLIFPSILVITLGPAVLTLMRTFKDFGR